MGKLNYTAFLKAYAAALASRLVTHPHEKLFEDRAAFLRNLPGDSLWQDILYPLCDFAAELVEKGTLSESDAEDFVVKSCLDLDLKIHVENAILDRADDIERVVRREISERTPYENPLHDLRQSEFDCNRRSA